SGNKIPKTIEELNEQITQRKLPANWKFPITEQANIPEATDFLKRNLIFEMISEFVFQVKFLPPPSWELFDNQPDTDIQMQATK
ncbi:1362_t:CDS:1, partial [Gigaspora rosea]